MIDSLLLYNIVITVFKNYLLLDRNFVKAYSKNITCYTCWPRLFKIIFDTADITKGFCAITKAYIDTMQVSFVLLLMFYLVLLL